MKFVSELPFVHDDHVLAGDFSYQQAGNYSVIAYGLASITADRIPLLDKRLNALVASVAGAKFAGSELHAKELWNGSERARSPFRELATKAQMLQFFAAFARVIRSLAIDATVVLTVHPAHFNRRQIKVLKSALPGAAVAQLNDTIKERSGKHIGRPMLMLDMEGGVAPGKKTDHPFVSWVHQVPGTQFDEMKFFQSASPTYVSTDSGRSRLVQVADILAYFAAKHLSLFGTITDVMKGWSSKLPASTVSQMADCNAALAMWEALNLEVVLLRHETTYRHEPAWLLYLCQPWVLFFNEFKDRITTFTFRLRMTSGVQLGRVSTVRFWRIPHESQG